MRHEWYAGELSVIDASARLLLATSYLLPPCAYFLWRLRTMYFSVRGLWRVRRPMAGLPQGVLGWPPMGARPSPPPWGWSTGFITEPRTDGRRPSHRERPALP